MKQTRGFHVKLAAVGLLAVAVVVLAGCSSQERVLPASEAAPILAYSEAKTDNLLKAINADDYDAFARDMDEAMRSAIPRDKWAAFRGDIAGKMGVYESRQVDSVRQAGDYYAVVYAAAFSQQKTVTVRVVFRAAEPHSISGLWFK